MKKIATSVTIEYFPGLVALKNSIDMWMEDTELFVFGYSKSGDNLENLIKDLGVKYIMEAPMLGPIIDNGQRFRNGLTLGPDMFARLLIPNYCSGRVFYVDCDCVLLQPVDELWNMDMGGMPSACVFRPDIGWVGGHRHDDMASGTVLIDCEEWRRIKLTEECFDTMRKSVSGQLTRKFNVNVESVMSYVHDGKFIHLPANYQNLTYYGALCKEDKVAHFAGPKPWTINGHRNGNPLNYTDIWSCAFNNDKSGLLKLIQNLPEKRKNNPWDKRLRV
jgi:hypothetical protein